MKIPHKAQTIIIIIIIDTNRHSFLNKPREHSIIELAIHLRFLSQHLVLSLAKCIDRWWLLWFAVRSNAEWLYRHENKRMVFAELVIVTYDSLQYDEDPKRTVPKDQASAVTSNSQR